MINQPPLWIAAAFLLGTLLWLTVSDMRDFRAHNILLNDMPNNSVNKWTLLLIAAGLLYNFTAATDFYRYLVGAVAGYALFWLIEISYETIGKTADPYRGNTKLLAAGGAWCSWTGLPFIIIIAGLAVILWPILSKQLSAQVKNKAMSLPHTPFLALAIAIVWTAQKIHA